MLFTGAMWQGGISLQEYPRQIDFRNISHLDLKCISDSLHAVHAKMLRLFFVGVNNGLTVGIVHHTTDRGNQNMQ